jgi:hypothetical protein
MSLESAYRVFVSYTGQDLEAHAEVVSDTVKGLNNSDATRSWVAIDHKFWAPTGRPSVKECMEQVARCHILIVLVAFRYGWVPSPEDGGDGKKSITQMEVERARELGLEVIPFIVEDDAKWNIADVEGLTNRTAQKRLVQFKNELRKSLAGFFESPDKLAGPTILALQNAAERIEQPRKGARPSRAFGRPQDAEQIVPLYYDPNSPPKLEERLQTLLPKRILALDSAGARTAIVLGYLERLEGLLRLRYGDSNFRLCDYFDLIAASGASAVIAADLSRGGTVAEVRKNFVACVASLTSTKTWWSRLPYGFSPRYRSEGLINTLEKLFGITTISSVAIETGLAIILTRLDTRQISTLTNHPHERKRLDSLLLSRVILAGFSRVGDLEPVQLQMADDLGYYFSGETSVGPDPALHAFLVATGPTFPFHWRAGRRRILLVSIGAGKLPIVKTPYEPNTLTAKYVIEAASTLIAGLKEQSDLALAALTHNDTQQLAGESDGDESRPSVLSYRRFDVVLDAAHLVEIGLGNLAQRIDQVTSIDEPEMTDPHFEIGKRVSEFDMKGDLFQPSFDVRPLPC